MIQARQNMPRDQVSFRSVRVAGQDECIDADSAIGVEFCNNLIGIADNRSTATRAGPANARPEIVLSIPIGASHIPQLRLTAHAIGTAIKGSLPNPGAFSVIEPAQQSLRGERGYYLVSPAQPQPPALAAFARWLQDMVAAGPVA